uniref:DAGKc domain-containing protein n=1 Tax=Arcella intermedia TaxID=1963864 RepID=A0A6B2L9J9_9EUKA
MVLVNPASGHRRGTLIYNNIVKPMLENSDIRHDCYITQSARSTTEFILRTDLGIYSMVMIVSGDGLFHIILNAIYRKLRNESQFLDLLKKLPFAIIPSGTSNGVALSLKFDNAYLATKSAIEGSSNPLDMFQIVQMESKNVLWDCCVFSWALPGEHDQYQERILRWIPFASIRELLAPLIVIGISKTFRASISFKEVSTSVDYYKKKPHVINFPDTPVKFWAVSNIPRPAPDVYLSPQLKIDEGAVDFVFSDSISRLELLDLYLKMADASYLNHPKAFIYKVTELTLEPRGEHKGFMSLSGESISTEPVRLKVYPQAARIVYKK